MNIKINYFILIICLVSAACGSQKKIVSTPPPVMSNANDSASYFMGATMAENAQNSGVDTLSTYFVLKGIEDILFNNKEDVTTGENMQYVYKYMEKMKGKIAENNKIKAEDFLKENKKDTTVKVINEGIQYKVLKNGDPNGEKPRKSSRVKVHYEGRLKNGKIFDSSYKRGEPIEFGLNGVIKGWTIALQEMRIGDKWTIFIHPKFGYGKRGAGKDIGPNTLLVFDVELLGFK